MDNTQRKRNIRVPVEYDPDLNYYPIPKASQYTLREDGRVYRIRKDGRLRELKQYAQKRDHSSPTVGVVYDGNKNKTTIRPLAILKKIHEVYSALRELPANYISLPSVWCCYYVSKHGDVLFMDEDALGQTYYLPKTFYKDTSSSDYTVYERISIRDSSFRPRTYTRLRLQMLYTERMKELEEMEETRHKLMELFSRGES